MGQHSADVDGPHILRYSVQQHALPHNCIHVPSSYLSRTTELNSDLSKLMNLINLIVTRVIALNFNPQLQGKLCMLMWISSNSLLAWDDAGDRMSGSSISMWISSNLLL